MVHGDLLDDPKDVERYAEAWDALALEAGEPYCLSAWMLAWWREAAPPGARLRVAVALERGQLVGIAPFYGERRLGLVEWLRPLATPVSHRLGPLARVGRERQVATALGHALAAARPTPALVTLDALERGSPWPQLLARAWPGGARPRLRRELQSIAPVVHLGGTDYDGWLRARSPGFRQQVRRRRRRLEACGATFRRVDDADDVVSAVRDMARLHHARWRSRGGSAALGPRVEGMVAAAARPLSAAGRLWLSTIEADRRTISAHLFVRAGDQATYWLGGHDDRWSACQPGIQALTAAVQDALAYGITRLDLGPGDQAYKRRLTGASTALDFVALVPAGACAPSAHAALAARRVRRGLRRATG